ncbi:3-oxoacyl-[acyl-carrier-protein] synthase III C-terminal domain-containing protein [Pseudomonas sp. NPDC007930]|uniref:ketoacyl-ACP synthase III n=1 Tax=Pseudomonas sp. NPDC007930 TaxID=3364417 RepID=UPI0036E9CD63
MTAVPVKIKKIIDGAKRVRGAKLSGLACAVPTTVADVRALNETFGAETIEKIIATTGVEKRHVVKNICASDLCYAAANKLIDDLKIERDSIDTLIFLSQTHDHVLPATACILQERLGLPDTTAAFDVAMGCSGYVYGLWLAHSLIAGGSNRVLLLVGDTISQLINNQDRSVAALFGDAGSATLIDKATDAKPVDFILGTDGKGAQNLEVPSGGARDRVGAYSSSDGIRSGFNLYMNGPEIFSFTLSRVPSLVAALTGLRDQIEGGSAVDRYYFHQANSFMLQHLAKRMKLPLEAVSLQLRNFGNTSSVSIPLAISEDAQGRPVTGNFLLAGFGVGYSWAGCVIELENLYVSPLTFVEE